jgi:tRNA dimethylallyltransferase
MSLVIAVVGPTATGKSDLGLALAEQLGGEIVNTDAMQLYRGMDIGTAKLTPADRRGIPHHQLDVLDVDEDASVADYQRGARADLAAIDARGARAVAVGGSGLYVRALLDRMDFPGTDPDVRARLEERVEAEGSRALHVELERVDPVAAAGIGPRNARRIVRALEVVRLTGRPYSASLPQHVYEVPALQIGLDCDRAVLDARIEARVEHMWEAGLVDEVRALAAHGIGRTARSAMPRSSLCFAVTSVRPRRAPPSLRAPDGWPASRWAGSGGTLACTGSMRATRPSSAARWTSWPRPTRARSVRPRPTRHRAVVWAHDRHTDPPSR